ncbi:hypothetical protein LTR97_004613 [Elasticomyces elasticus]|uniref:Dyp-type peroxidase n=1 Tax=Elasticomyces elasticus TaxID=574655 RepID=A0AAN7W8R7_9PEZI|nr:hypothetical protein LTR97_004613 [Elasticomyces elasticus]
MASNQQPSGGLDLNNVQGDILLDGLAKRNETFFFFKIKEAKNFCEKLSEAADEITHTLHSTSARENITNNRGNGIVPTVGANIAFSFQGLQKMSSVLDDLPLETQDSSFEAGMKAAAASLQDPMNSETSEPAWESPYSIQDIHGVILVAGSGDKLTGIFGSSLEEVHQVSGKVRPGENKGHEHFGFLDGVSEPAVDGVNPSGTIPPGQDTVPQGVILCGRPGDRIPHPAWMTDGSFLCFRKLKQNVQDWNKFLMDASNQLGTWSGQLGSRLIGRWQSGCPVMSSPHFDDKNIAANPNRVNNFEFDKDQFECPLGAHIRKMNPREDIGRSAVNQFRVLRRGIPYGEEVDEDPSGERGLLFVCYQSNIDFGFAFLQQSWANNPNFSQPGSGLDAVMGQSNSKKTVDMKGLFPQDAERPLALSGINRFVVPKGGEYFFTPSMSALRTTLSNVK